MSSFANSSLKILEEGALVFWGILSSSFVSAILTVFVGSFIAMRAFYIQKRHERMAEKYKKTFELLGHLAEHPNGKFSNLSSLEIREKYLEMVNLLSTAKIYFGPEACEILTGFMKKIDLLITERGGKAVTDALQKRASDLISECFDELAKAAKKDLRPNLIEFAKHFVTVFIKG